MKNLKLISGIFLVESKPVISGVFKYYCFKVDKKIQLINTSSQIICVVRDDPKMTAYSTEPEFLEYVTHEPIKDIKVFEFIRKSLKKHDYNLVL